MTGERASVQKKGEESVEELRVALRHRERQIDAMRRTSDALFSYTSIGDLVRETLRLGIEVLDAEAGSLLLHNERTNQLVFEYVVGEAADSLTGFAMPADQGIAGQVFQSGEPDISHQVKSREEFNPEIDEKTGYSTDSMLTVPVKRVEGRALGVMQVLNAHTPFDELDLEVLEVLSAVAAAAIENARLMQSARKAAIVSVIGDISHDIKNMLTPIQTGVWTLEPMLDEMFEALDEIHKACPESEDIHKKLPLAMSIVRDDYSWILANALEAADQVQGRTREIADAVKGEIAPPCFEDGNLNDTAKDIARSLTVLAYDAKLDLRLHLDPQLPSSQFDKKQIYNAVYNLVNNAIPETEAGGVIEVRTYLDPALDEKLCLEVSDTGKGMSPEVRDLLFSDGAVSTKVGGTGLGTRIASRVVQRHGGTIDVESEVGKGTTFRIILPLRQEQ